MSRVNSQAVRLFRKLAFATKEVMFFDKTQSYSEETRQFFNDLGEFMGGDKFSCNLGYPQSPSGLSCLRPPDEEGVASMSLGTAAFLVEKIDSFVSRITFKYQSADMTSEASFTGLCDELGVNYLRLTGLNYDWGYLVDWNPGIGKPLYFGGTSKPASIYVIADAKKVIFRSKLNEFVYNYNQEKHKREHQTPTVMKRYLLDLLESERQLISFAEATGLDISGRELSLERLNDITRQLDTIDDLLFHLWVSRQAIEQGKSSYDETLDTLNKILAE